MNGEGLIHRKKQTNQPTRELYQWQQTLHQRKVQWDVVHRWTHSSEDKWPKQRVPFFRIMLATVVEGDAKAPFSIATTPRCRGGRYSFPWIAPFYPWYVPFMAVLSKEVSSTIFWVFGMTRPGLEPRSPGPLANTLPTRPISWLLGLCTRVQQ